MNKEFSSATQAVLNVAAQTMECTDGFLPYEHELMAVILRAAADQVVPYEATAPWNEVKCDYDGDHWEMRQWVRHELLAIAAELDGGAQ